MVTLSQPERYTLRAQAMPLASQSERPANRDGFCETGIASNGHRRNGLSMNGTPEIHRQLTRGTNRVRLKRDFFEADFRVCKYANQDLSR